MYERLNVVLGEDNNIKELEDYIDSVIIIKIYKLVEYMLYKF